MKLFSKKLTKTDIGKRMSIPTKKLTLFPRFQFGCHAVELKVEDEEGHVWNMRCTIRKQNYKKPVMSSGWIRFVRRKNLVVGDEVTLSMVEDEAQGGAKYKIKVKKAIKLFGVIVAYTPDHGAA